MPDLDAALAASALQPILIVKHSLTCGSSAMAMEEVEDFLPEKPPGVDVYLVRIQMAREVSRAIEQQLGVRHESPQVLLVRDGRVLWHTSHFRITATNLASALAQHLPQAQTTAS